jgi:hypothetical protein
VGVLGLQRFCEGSDTYTDILPVTQSLAYHQNNSTTMVTEIQMSKAECQGQLKSREGILRFLFHLCDVCLRFSDLEITVTITNGNEVHEKVGKSKYCKFQV